MAMGRNAYEANRRVGERMMEDEVKYLGQKAQELLAEYHRIKPEHTLRTFVDVERLWSQVITPHLDKLLCIQEDFSGQGRRISQDSVWYENRINPVYS